MYLLAEGGWQGQVMLLTVRGEKGQSIGTLKRSDWLIVSHTGDSVVTVKFQLSIL